MATDHPKKCRHEYNSRSTVSPKHICRCREYIIHVGLHKCDLCHITWKSEDSLNEMANAYEHVAMDPIPRKLKSQWTMEAPKDIYPSETLIKQNTVKDIIDDLNRQLNNRSSSPTHSMWSF